MSSLVDAAQLAAAVPAYACFVLDALERAGFESWIVGGWVRDALMGNPAHDVDICTQAHWQDAARTLEAAGAAVHLTGTQHGTVTAVVDGHSIEVTTYRVEGTYTDLRHPDSVEFVDRVELDLARRDFTVNAIAFHPARGLCDLFDGAADIHARTIRCVGDPQKRFAEDALRVLRAVRFSARLNFTVEKNTQLALVSAAPELAHIARERIGAELTGIVATGCLAQVMDEQREVLIGAMPQLGPMMGFDQCSPYHCYDVWEHTRRVVAATEEFCGGQASSRLRWAALLHDIAKPRTFTVDERGQGHFFGHPAAGAAIADRMLRHMALPLSEVKPICALVRYHDRPVKATRHSVLRLLTALDGACKGQAVPLAYETLVLKRADALSKAQAYRSYASEVDKIEWRLRMALAEGAPYRVSDLVISGSDVIEAFGGRPGPWVGYTLDNCLREVVHGRLSNSREELLAWLQKQ